MASRLLNELINVAKARKISKMMAYVRGDNKPMIAIFEQAQFKRKFTGDPSDVELVLDVASLA
jgi:ribosomal protein S18 acetylase RimI-like enzyme